MDFMPHSVMFEMINQGIEKELITGEEESELREMTHRLHHINEELDSL